MQGPPRDNAEGRSPYARRFRAMWDSCGPGSWNTLFVTRSEIERCRRVVADSTNSQAAQGDTAALAWAHKVVRNTVHPDTNEVIPWPFRMSAHVPCNTALLVAMLGAASPMAHAAAQTANQGFNAFQFYFNRNASNDVSVHRLAAATALAVSGAVVSVLCLDRWLARLPTSSRWASAGRLLLPFVGAAAAKPFQIAVMRSDELVTGVGLRDEAGRPLGVQSKAAGTRAVALTIATRVLYLVQPMLMPPLVMAAIARSSFGQRRSRVALAAMNVAIIAMSSSVMTPACIALFDQRACLLVTALEPGVAASLPPDYRDGYVYFNKGL